MLPNAQMCLSTSFPGSGESHIQCHVSSPSNVYVCAVSTVYGLAGVLISSLSVVFYWLCPSYQPHTPELETHYRTVRRSPSVLKRKRLNNLMSNQTSRLVTDPFALAGDSDVSTSDCERPPARPKKSERSRTMPLQRVAFAPISFPKKRPSLPHVDSATLHNIPRAAAASMTRVNTALPNMSTAFDPAKKSMKHVRRKVRGALHMTSGAGCMLARSMTRQEQSHTATEQVMLDREWNRSDDVIASGSGVADVALPSQPRRASIL
ncbi:hypothetical protein FISHEDRAFT_61560 [Fistulina hepatica ATCC 64428]|uniref:Uncharacterized protein n=1 Tax=Fistulina hepatica ATCC 64428 TaxID=1128425 RepID=A0A0D7A4Q4_9AGAR|nr:hypothetical protein FISHEDRAFT_61560 [Fistulina hepatica ATCC 64428]